MSRWRSLVMAAALAILVVPQGLAGAVLAHETHPTVGNYRIVGGFLNEPALAGEPNGLDLRVTIPSENNKPVQGLEKTLKATVMTGGGARTMDLKLEPVSGKPGSYAARFVPTKAGSYIFRVTGTIEGTPVDERFESGPGRFNDVESTQALQFPDRVPEGLALAGEVEAARNEAAAARMIALAGLASGVAGIAVGAASLLVSRRRGELRASARQAVGRQP